MAEHLLFVGRMTSKFDNQSAALEDKKGLTVSGDLKYSLATLGSLHFLADFVKDIWLLTLHIILK